MIRYFIRTTNERQLDSSYSQIEYELLVDYKKENLKSFIKFLEYMDSLNCECVLLEDDCILCNNFKHRIETAINKYPNNIINFFNSPTLYTDIEINNNYSFMQCRYYPKGSFKVLIDNLKLFLNYPSKTKICPLLNRIAKRLDLKIVQYRPCLVQHLDNDSLIGNKPNSRRTPFFIDYLDELNISYDEANKHIEELLELMVKKFSQ